MSELTLAIATWEQACWRECVDSWHNHGGDLPEHIVRRRGILDAYQEIYESSTEPFLAYLHDDLVCHEFEWDLRVLREFADPAVAIVGFAGAPGYGHPSMYSQPYHHSSLGRVGFRSNLLNAEQHGARFAGAMDVAVLDGLALIVRRTFLDELNGWEWRRATSDHPAYDYFMYSEALCFHALRRGRRVRLVGVACDHLGGRSTGLNPDLNPDFEGEHRRLFEEFRDVLPVRIGEAQ